jgi:hypothetical protein
VLDAASQLDLIRNLPGLELDEEVNEQSLKVLGQLVGNVVERFVCAVEDFPAYKPWKQSRGERCRGSGCAEGRPWKYE